MKTTITIFLCLASGLLIGQKMPGSFYRGMGAYQFSKTEIAMIGLIEESPVIIYSDGNIRGLQKKGKVFEIGNALADFTNPEGTLSFNKDNSITLSSTSEEKQGIRINLDQKEISFSNHEVSLHGMLILPKGDGPFPCIIMTHGSGPEKKEASLGLAGLFAVNGIAAFIYDKRFVRELGEKWEDYSFDDYAEDAVAAASAIIGLKNIDSNKIGIFGHSQGGWVAPLAVSKNSMFKFLIISAGNAVTPVEQHLWMGTQAFIQNGGTEKVAQEILEFRKIKYEAGITGDLSSYNEALPIAQRKPWFSKTGGNLPTGKFWKLNGYYDPEPALLSVRCPVLVMGGALDNHSNTTANMKIFHEIFGRSGNNEVTFKVFPMANHAYLETTTGKFYESEFKNLKRFVPGYFETLTEWVKTQTE